MPTVSQTAPRWLWIDYLMIILSLFLIGSWVIAIYLANYQLFLKTQIVEEALVQERLAGEVVLRTDGWQGYRVLDNPPGRHVRVVPASGPEALKLLPWLHTLIANVKGNIRSDHHGVSQKHLPHCLAEFCYRFPRRFWEPPMFNCMRHACLNPPTITFLELRA